MTSNCVSTTRGRDASKRFKIGKVIGKRLSLECVALWIDPPVIVLQGIGQMGCQTPLWVAKRISQLSVSGCSNPCNPLPTEKL